MVNVSNREIALSAIIVILLFMIAILGIICIMWSDPCPMARDRCYDGCGDGLLSSLCKSGCTNAYEKCELGGVPENSS